MATPPATHHHPPPPPPPDPYSGAPSARSVPILLPVFILFFILVTFLSIFLFRDLLHYLSAVWISGRSANGPSPPGGTEGQQTGEQGLDPGILASFPTLPYSAMRGLQEGKCGRECAVCLSEFAAGDVIRLLTVCCHAFHPICIDSWLAAHTTCPLCRSDLEAPPDEAAVLAVKEAVGDGGGSHTIIVEEAVEEEETKPQ